MVELEGLEPSARIPDAIRTIAQGLAQLADALDAGGSVPVELASIVKGLTNGTRSSKDDGMPSP